MPDTPERREPLVISDDEIREAIDFMRGARWAIDRSEKEIERLKQSKIAEDVYITKLELDLKVAIKALDAALLCIVTTNPEKCDSCEPGNAYEPEFVCGVHQTINTIREALAQIEKEAK